MRTSVFLAVGFCHRWCGSQKQNCTLPKAFATLALPGELLGATRRECLERGPLKDAELWVSYAPLLPTSSYKECSGRTHRHAEVGPTTVSVCPLTQTEALRRPPLAFLRASGRPRSCPSFSQALPLPVARLAGCRESPGRQSCALDGRKAHDARSCLPPARVTNAHPR
jgi:hypothetical protein